MRFKKQLFVAPVLFSSVLLTAQGQGGLDPADIYKPLKDSWPTYSGDYTGRRYSALAQVNQTTVKNLSLAWVSRLSGPPALTGAGPGAAGFGGFGGFGRGGGGGAQTIVGGEGTGDFGGAGGA